MANDSAKERSQEQRRKSFSDLWRKMREHGFVQAKAKYHPPRKPHPIGIEAVINVQPTPERLNVIELALAYFGIKPSAIATPGYTHIAQKQPDTPPAKGPTHLEVHAEIGAFHPIRAHVEALRAQLMLCGFRNVQVFFGEAAPQREESESERGAMLITQAERSIASTTEMVNEASAIQRGETSSEVPSTAQIVRAMSLFREWVTNNENEDPAVRQAWAALALPTVNPSELTN